jgi:hypothetical protein
MTVFSTTCGPTIPNEVYCSCSTPYITAGEGADAGKTFVGNCKTGNPKSKFFVKDSVKLKTLLAGTRISPWAKIEFIEPCSHFFITTGNESMEWQLKGEPVEKNCRAVIKSFQYSWGTTGQGNTAKVIIHDEQGSSFKLFVDRLFKNLPGGALPQHGVYKVVATWGWFVSGMNGCDSGIANDDQIICSPQCWFIPMGVQSSIQNGKFIYEIELTDTLQRAQYSINEQTIGKPSFLGITPLTYFTDAVEQLGRISRPQFRAAFKQVDDNGVTVPMKFHLQSGTTPNKFHPDKGLGKQSWKTDSRDPLKTICNWLKEVLAEGGIKDQGRGITINYDPTYHCKYYDGASDNTDNYGNPCKDDKIPANGQLLFWADPQAATNGKNLNVTNKCKALYIVNGGNCSSVLSFQPTMKWNFQSAVNAGGTATTNSGEMRKLSADNLLKSFGNVIKSYVPVTDDAIDALGKEALPYIYKCISNNHRANFPIDSIEAELRVQGDPSLFLCTPREGTGRTVAIVVVNPFYLDSADPLVNPNDCLKWTQGPGTASTNSSSCNEILTNRAWFIRSVDHQVKEGSYITTLKVWLPVPGSELATFGSPFTPLGGDELGYTFDDPTSGGVPIGYGTQECIHRYPVGGEAVDSQGCALIPGDGGSEGYGDFCDGDPHIP